MNANKKEANKTEATVSKNNNAPKRHGVTFKNNVNVRDINREGKGNPVTGMKTRTRVASVRANPIINRNRTRRNASAALIAAHAWRLGETIEDMYAAVDASKANANAKARAKTFIYNKWYVIQNLRKPVVNPYGWGYVPAPGANNNDDLYR